MEQTTVEQATTEERTDDLQAILEELFGQADMLADEAHLIELGLL